MLSKCRKFRGVYRMLFVVGALCKFALQLGLWLRDMQCCWQWIVLMTAPAASTSGTIRCCFQWLQRAAACDVVVQRQMRCRAKFAKVQAAVHCSVHRLSCWYACQHAALKNMQESGVGQG